MIEEPVSELETSDGTLYRFGSDDLVLQHHDGVQIGTYRWRRSSDFAIDEDVQVDFEGTIYEYVDEDTEVTRVRGAAPHGLTEGCHLIWYEETETCSDVAIVLDRDLAVLGGLVEEVQDDDEDDEFMETTSATPVALARNPLATETAGRPMVPILLVLFVVLALVVLVG
jgi:hypothetical protein